LILQEKRLKVLVLLSGMSATTTQLLSSGEFCKLTNDKIPVQIPSTKVCFIPINQKCQILNCDKLVANERYNIVSELCYKCDSSSLLVYWEGI